MSELEGLRGVISDEIMVRAIESSKRLSDLPISPSRAANLHEMEE